MIATKPTPAAGRTGQRLGRKRWTFDELGAELSEINLPVELWDGEAIESPAPSFFHQEIVGRFHDLLKAWVPARDLGKTAVSPVDMVLSPRRSTQPDVIFVSKPRLEIITGALRGAADLVAEVISPESRRRDRIDKRDLYEQHGVREYWLIDPEAQTVEVLYLERGAYRLTGRWQPGEKAKSRLLDGFVVDVSALFASG
jgi:Uma2 family endonuclease